MTSYVNYYNINNIYNIVQADVPTGDGDKKANNEVKGEKSGIDPDGMNGENQDTSEGQDGSEEDLPWILQKAASETTLSDEKVRLNICMQIPRFNLFMFKYTEGNLISIC